MRPRCGVSSPLALNALYSDGLGGAASTEGAHREQSLPQVGFLVGTYRAICVVLGERRGLNILIKLCIESSKIVYMTIPPGSGAILGGYNKY